MAMKLCANENVPGDCVTALREHGHDVLWIRDVAPGSTDEVVLSLAQSEHRILVTFDKDFGELVFRRGKRASVGIILFRLPKRSPAFLTKRVVDAFAIVAEWGGHYAVVDEHSVRLRPLPEVSR